MRRPFVLRVQSDDPGIARGIARALVRPLQERGARVLLDGVSQGGGGELGVHLVTGPRGLPGTTLRIGIWDDEQGARWLAPIDAPDDADTAAQRTMAFLEEWGFVRLATAREEIV